MNFLDQQQIKYKPNTKFDETRHQGATLFRFSIGLFLIGLVYVSSYAGLRYEHVIVAKRGRVMASPTTTVPMLKAYKPLMRAEQSYKKFHHSGF